MNARRLMRLPKSEDDNLPHQAAPLLHHSKLGRSTSAVGQIRPPRDVRGMSVIPPKANVNADIFVRPVRARRRH
jgi:hypothetical protein